MLWQAIFIRFQCESLWWCGCSRVFTLNKCEIANKVFGKVIMTTIIRKERSFIFSIQFQPLQKEETVLSFLQIKVGLWKQGQQLKNRLLHVLFTYRLCKFHTGKDALLKVPHLTKEKKIFTLAFLLIFHLYECVCKKKRNCFSSQSCSDIGPGKCS